MTENIANVMASLDSRDDEKTVAQIAIVQEDVRRLHEKKQREIKEIIATYASAVGKLKQTIEKEEQRIARTVQETQELISRQEQVNDEIAKIRDKGESMDRKLRELDQELILAEKRLQVAKNADDVNVPKIKHALNLYANISCIRWDFNKTDHVKGYVSIPGDGTVRPFDVDKQLMTPYEVTNYLWDLMA